MSDKYVTKEKGADITGKPSKSVKQPGFHGLNQNKDPMNDNGNARPSPTRSSKATKFSGK